MTVDFTIKSAEYCCKIKQKSGMYTKPADSYVLLEPDKGIALTKCTKVPHDLF